MDVQKCSNTIHIPQVHQISSQERLRIIFAPFVAVISYFADAFFYKIENDQKNGKEVTGAESSTSIRKPPLPEITKTVTQVEPGVIEIYNNRDVPNGADLEAHHLPLLGW